MNNLEELKTRLKNCKIEVSKKKGDEHGNKKGIFLGNALKLGTELVAAVL